jgi:hypothetical protein
MGNKKQFYNLSKDYDLLYSKICDGYEIACFVNYNLRSLEDKYPPMRDICLIRRRKAYDIDFLARGISYGSVSDYDKDKYSEKELFLSECERMDVEWIDNLGYSKDDVILKVAEFAKSYNTEKMFYGEETIEQTINEVKDYVKFDK